MPPERKIGVGIVGGPCRVLVLGYDIRSGRPPPRPPIAAVRPKAVVGREDGGERLSRQPKFDSTASLEGD